MNQGMSFRCVSTFAAAIALSLFFTAGAHASTRTCGTTTVAGVEYKVRSYTWGMNHASIEPVDCATAKRLFRKALRKRGAAFDGWMCSHRRRSLQCWRGASGGVGVKGTRKGVTAATARARSCPDFTVGVVAFSRIKVTRVSCSKARRLLDQATLDVNRHGAATWLHAAWLWTFRGLDETSAVVRGRRGERRIRATFAVR